MMFLVTSDTLNLTSFLRITWSDELFWDTPVLEAEMWTSYKKLSAFVLNCKQRNVTLCKPRRKFSGTQFTVQPV